MALTESSILWTTSGTGDGTATGYTQAQVLKWMRMLFLYDMTADGVVPGYLNALAVSDAGSRNLQVNTGGAIVAGFPYFNDGAGNLTLTHPVVGTTGWRLVLRASWAAQTVRLVLLQNTDGVPAAPALTQVDGTTYEISLAYGTITTGDVVAITDDRDFLQPRLELRLEHFVAGLFTADATGRAKFADGIWTTAKLADGVLSGDASGRAKMADGYLSADATGRAKVADGFLAQAKMGSDTLQMFTIPIFHAGGIGSLGGLATSYAKCGGGNGEKTNIRFDKDKLPAGATVKLRACMAADGGATAYLKLFDLTASAEVTGSEISTTTVSPGAVVESSDFAGALTGGGSRQYCLIYKTSSGANPASIYTAYLTIEW